jgi:basic membrane protein A
LRHDRTRIGLAGLTALVPTALLAGCGAPPPASGGSSSSSSSSSGSAATAGFLPCIVSDQGGFNDHSFNEQGLDGVKEAAQKAGVTPKQVQSATANDYASNIANLIRQKCTVVVASGFNLVAAVKASATKNTKTDFVMIDDNSIKAANVKPVVFNTNEAAFLGGYAAAAYSKSGVVATWGGAQYPSVTIYMDGIADGIAYYNKQKHKSVKLLGWDVQSQKGVFAGGFLDQNKAKTITANFLNQKADVIIPVAGGLYQGAAAAIKSAKSDAVLEGVDADLYVTDTNGYKGLFLTSILKNIKSATSAVVSQAATEGSFDNSQYVGTLKNDGVGLSAFHDYESKVPSSLSADLDTITKSLTDGSIKASSPSAFTG